MHSRHWLALGGATGAILLVGFGYFVVRGAGTPKAGSGRDALENGGTSASTVGKQDSTWAPAAVERASRRLAGRLGTTRRAEALHNALADTLLVYSGGSADDWLDYLGSYGVAPPQILTQDQAKLESFWTRSQLFFRTADLNWDGATSALNPREPPLTELEKIGGALPEDAGKFRMAAKRNAGRAFLREGGKLDRVRVSVPGRFRSISPVDGSVSTDDFEGTMSLEFTYDPEKEIWVLTEFILEGRRDSDEMPTAPILL